MLDFVKDLFGIAKDTRSVVQDVQDHKSKARGVKNKILAEVEFNMDLILDHYLDKKCTGGKNYRETAPRTGYQSHGRGF
jgi:hypothetical protein